jgi:hypothetical protein
MMGSSGIPIRSERRRPDANAVGREDWRTCKIIDSLTNRIDIRAGQSVPIHRGRYESVGELHFRSGVGSMKASGNARKLLFTAVVLTSAFVALLPRMASSCACGCGVFDVGTGSMMPTGTGGSVWAEFDYMNQNQNWHGTSKADAADNDDKKIRTEFYSVGSQYMFNRSWGIRATVPYDHRYFRTTDEDSGEITSYTHSALGDMRFSAVYTGFSPDMSTGANFGLKLPTGDYKQNGFDRDTAIGSGSTDLLLGGWHMGRLTSDNKWSWYTQGEWDQPVLIQDHYRPGTEVNIAAGLYHEGVTAGAVRITPLFQLVGSWRAHDRGAESDPDNSGYTRLLADPGVELGFGRSTTLHADVGLPVFQDVRGDQLVAPALVKVVLSRRF